jgi:hypothetical protein
MLATPGASIEGSPMLYAMILASTPLIPPQPIRLVAPTNAVVRQQPDRPSASAHQATFVFVGRKPPSIVFGYKRPRDDWT